MVRLFVFVLLLYLVVTEENDFLCRQCGKALTQSNALTDMEAEDSEGKKPMLFLSKEYNVLYDVFPEIVSGGIYVLHK